MEAKLCRETPIGPLCIAERDGVITHLLFGHDHLPALPEAETGALTEAYRQLDEYLAGTRREFTLRLSPAGTEFQRGVWNALLDIPYGETRSYKEVACAIGNEKGTRAVGSANHSNPISVFIPCHRVIGADGKLTGYGGGLPVKERLLALERGETALSYCFQVKSPQE